MKKTKTSAKSKSARELLALNLRILRVKGDITQDQLAHESGVNKNYISQIETESRAVSIDIVEKLANALGVAIAVLLADS